MLTVEEIKQLASRAADGNRASIARFRGHAIAVGIVGRPGGWIYLPNGERPFAHGWQAAAKIFAGRLGFTGRDLLVEMSKRSVRYVDIVAAHEQALADAAAYAQNAAYVDGSVAAGPVMPRCDCGDHLAFGGTHREDCRRGRWLRSGASSEVLATALDEALIENAERDAAAGRPLVVTFDRVGPRWTGPATRVELDRELVNDFDNLERALRKHVRRHLVSREFDVDVDLKTGVVLIDRGRFGRGQFTPVPQQAPPAPEGYRPLEPSKLRAEVAYARFAQLADSGGPGTANGVFAAVEVATTVTEAELAAMAKRMIERLRPIDVNPHAFADALTIELARLGFKVK